MESEDEHTLLNAQPLQAELLPPELLDIVENLPPQPHPHRKAPARYLCQRVLPLALVELAEVEVQSRGDQYFGAGGVLLLFEELQVWADEDEVFDEVFGAPIAPLCHGLVHEGGVELVEGVVQAGVVGVVFPVQPDILGDVLPPRIPYQMVALLVVAGGGSLGPVGGFGAGLGAEERVFFAELLVDLRGLEVGSAGRDSIFNGQEGEPFYFSSEVHVLVVPRAWVLPVALVVEVFLLNFPLQVFYNFVLLSILLNGVGLFHLEGLGDYSVLLYLSLLAFEEGLHLFDEIVGVVFEEGGSL